MRKVPLATNSIYHVYNRGVEKRDVFLDSKYYFRFLSILKHYLNYDYPYSLLARSLKRIKSKGKRSRDFERLETKRIKPPAEIISFCLMPNHYHILLKQDSDIPLWKYMQRLGVAYTLYVNKRYGLVGHVFQGKYQVKVVSHQSSVSRVAGYIRNNPVRDGLVQDWIYYRWLWIRPSLKIT